MDNLRSSTLNCKGLSDEKKRRDVFNWLRQKKLDIYCLQEVHINNSQTEQVRWESEWGYKTIFSILDSSKCGIAILLNKTFENKIHSIISDSFGRYVIIDNSIQNRRVTLVSLYGPNSDSPDFFTILKEIICSNDLQNNYYNVW
mgnify:CR=1 FL=1